MNHNKNNGNNNNNNNNISGGSSSSSEKRETMMTVVAKNTTTQQKDFELPIIPEEDVILVENILEAMQSLGTEDLPICEKYQVKIISNGYMLRAFFPSSDIFELDLDDLLFLKSISPSRIDSVCIARTALQGVVELVVKVLDHKQRIMVTRSTSFSATRKRKWNVI
jgi:hypothetical protein